MTVKELASECARKFGVSEEKIQAGIKDAVMNTAMDVNQKIPDEHLHLYREHLMQLCAMAKACPPLGLAVLLETEAEINKRSVL